MDLKSIFKFGKKPATTKPADTGSVPDEDAYSLYESGLTANDVADAITDARAGKPYKLAALWPKLLASDLLLAACAQTRKLSTIANRPKLIRRDGDKTIAVFTDKRYAEFWDMLQKAGLRSLISHLASNFIYGYSCAITNWEDGGGTIRNFTHVHPTRMQFDRASNPAIMGIDAMKEYPLSKMTPHQSIFVNYDVFSEEPAVAGAVYVVAWSAFMRSRSIVAWNRYVDKFGSPVLMAWMPEDDWKDSSKRSSLKTQLTNMVGGGVVIAPMSKSWHGNDKPIELTSVAGQNAKVHDDRITKIDNEYVLLFLGQRGSTEGEPGRLGKNASMDRVVENLVESDCARLATALTKEVIQPAWLFRHGTLADAPELDFDIAPAEARLALSTVIKNMTVAGYPPTVDDVEHATGMTVDTNKPVEPPAKGASKNGVQP